MPNNNQNPAVHGRNIKLTETPPTRPPVELSFNVINRATGQKLNKEPLFEEAARSLAHQLQESDSKIEFLVKSNRATLMG